MVSISDFVTNHMFSGARDGVAGLLLHHDGVVRTPRQSSFFTWATRFLYFDTQTSTVCKTWLQSQSLLHEPLATCGSIGSISFLWCCCASFCMFPCLEWSQLWAQGIIVHLVHHCTLWTHCRPWNGWSVLLLNLLGVLPCRSCHQPARINGPSSCDDTRFMWIGSTAPIVIGSSRRTLYSL